MSINVHTIRLTPSLSSTKQLKVRSIHRINRDSTRKSVVTIQFSVVVVTSQPVATAAAVAAVAVTLKEAVVVTAAVAVATTEDQQGEEVGEPDIYKPSHIFVNSNAVKFHNFL